MMGGALVVIGLTIGGVSLLADVIGLGAQPGIIGWKQILGTALGLVILIVGISMLVRARSTGKDT
jgi:hypothetical protein